MRKRSRFVIALVLTLAAVIMPYGAVREGFLLNVVDFAVLMISGSSLLMFGAAGGIIWKTITEKSEQVQADMKSLPLTDFFFQAEDGIRDLTVTGVQTCALPI